MSGAGQSIPVSYGNIETALYSAEQYCILGLFQYKDAVLLI